MQRYSKILIIVLTFLVGVTGFAFNQYNDVYFLIKKNFTIFSEVYREVALRYVDEVNPEKLMRTGITAMLDALDPYTVLIDEADNQQYDIMTKGSYGGVGIEVGFKRGEMVVIAPIQGYSAYKKGIKAGDIIVSINGVSLDDLSPEEVQNIMYGEPGSTVTLQIKRFKIDEILTFELVRERIDVKNISYAGLIGPEKNIGYIVLNRFSQNTGDEIRSAIIEFKKNEDLTGIILDLRNNPGGLLEEAVKTVDKFIEPGIEVVRTRGRLAEHNNVLKSKENALFADKPLVILQNGGSASASEVVAGALQDLDRAVVLGEQSFGKGLVQIIKPLSYNTAIKITTSKYYTPSGRSIQSLIYTHDNQNSVIANPDTTDQSFKTRNGRTVYGGNGIKPDIEINGYEQTRLLMALQKNSHFFFFANQYSAKFDSSIVMDRTKIIDSFKSYLNEQNFTFQTETEKALQTVKNSLSEHNLLEQSKKEFVNLEQLVEEEKSRVFQNQEDLIYENLVVELIRRLDEQEKQIKARVKSDRYIVEALNLINDTSSYRNLLSAK